MVVASRHVAIAAYAAFLKLTLGTDDLVWLAPFVAREHSRAGKLVVVMLYGASVTFLVGVAAFIGWLASEAGDKMAQVKFWTKIAAGGLLLLYSLKMAKDDGWLACCGLQGDAEDDLEASLLEGGAQVEPVPPTGGEGGKQDCGDQSPAGSSQSPTARRQKGNVVVVALLGSLDDFTVYLVLATSGVFRWYELLVGTFAGCMLLAGIVVVFTESKAVSEILEKIPVWMVLAALATYILASALLES